METLGEHIDRLKSDANALQGPEMKEKLLAKIGAAVQKAVQSRIAVNKTHPWWAISTRQLIYSMITRNLVEDLLTIEGTLSKTHHE